MGHVQGVSQIQPSTQPQVVQGHYENKQSNLQPSISTITSSGPSLPVLILSKAFGGLKACFSFILGLFISRQPVAKAVISPSPQEKHQPLISDPQLKAKIVKSYNSGLDAEQIALNHDLNEQIANEIVERLDGGLDI